MSDARRFTIKMAKHRKMFCLESLRKEAERERENINVKLMTHIYVDDLWHS